jgi:prolyl oligopeptidase
MIGRAGVTKRFLTGLLGAMLASTSALAAPLTPPPAPPQKPVVETLYGTTVSDRYRYMEDEKDQSVIDWMKAEGRYTRGVFDSIPGHAALLKRVSAFTASFDAVQSLQRYGGRTFYEERAPGSDNFDLLVREADGTSRKLVDVAAIRAAHGGSPFAINYFQASNDGSKVAVGISQGGSEDASLFVYDVATGKQIAGPLPLARFGNVQWTEDDSTLFVSLLAEPKPGAPGTDKFKNSRIAMWDMKGPPVPVLGNGISKGIAFTPEEMPFLNISPGTSVAAALNVNGVQNEVEIYTTPIANVTSADAPWTPLVKREDGVTSGTAAGDHLYLLSHKDAPTFKVLALKVGQPLSAAKVIVPAEPGRLIESIATAQDGLYVQARRGVYSELFRVPLDGGPEEQIALPIKGSIGELFSDPRSPGAILLTESWANPPTVLAYDPATKGFTNLKLGSAPASFDPSRYEVSDLSAKAKDGVAVPLSYVHAKGGTHPHPLLLEAYGSYGISNFPVFSARRIYAAVEGIDYAMCHVRGGGELGDAWRLAGKDANKPNTWRDLIACGEALIAEGYTTPKLLFIVGGSAGGITMGRAMEERPDLFAGVIDMVPAANTIRSEFSPNGPPNIPEFGTITTEQGFRNLLAMDSYQNVKDGTHYPAIMITTGLNDPRVSSWEPGKFAARLRTTGTRAPVLLRVEEAAGHGIGSTRSQGDGLIADSISFIKWRSGAPGWQPAALPGAAVR